MAEADDVTLSQMYEFVRGTKKWSLRTACSNVTAPQGLVAFGTKKIKSSKVVTFAERVLARVLPLNGKELGGDRFVAILKGRRNEKLR